MPNIYSGYINRANSLSHRASKLTKSSWVGYFGPLVAILVNILQDLTSCSFGYYVHLDELYLTSHGGVGGRGFTDKQQDQRTSHDNLWQSDNVWKFLLVGSSSQFPAPEFSFSLPIELLLTFHHWQLLIFYTEAALVFHWNVNVCLSIDILRSWYFHCLVQKYAAFCLFSCSKPSLCAAQGLNFFLFRFLICKHQTRSASNEAKMVSAMAIYTRTV